MARQDQVLRYSIEVDGDKGLRAIADGLNDIAEAGGPAGDQAKALLEQLKGLAKQSAQAAGLASLKAQLHETGDALALAKLKAGDLQKQFDAAGAPTATLARQLTNAKNAVADLEGQFNKQTAGITKTENALAAAGVSTKNLDSAQRGIQATIANVAQQASGLSVNLGSVATETERAGEKAEHAGGLFAGLKEHLVEIVSIAAAVELAFKGIEFGKEGFKDAAAIEQSLARVKALAQGSAEQFGDMGDEIEKAARAVNVSTQQSATGLAALVSQGLGAKDAVDALIPSLQLAKIANIDVGAAAEEVATALKAFDEPASQAQSLVDQLTVASHGAAGGLGAMSKAAAELAPGAKAIGLSLQDTVAILGTLQTRGVDSQKAMEGLRNVFAQLRDPTSALRGELLALGDGSSSFSAAIKALTSGTPRANDALNTLDVSARNLVTALGQAGPDAIEKFENSLRSAGGTASETLKKINDTFGGAEDRFAHAIDAIGAKLAQPVLKPFADELNKLAGELERFSETEKFKRIQDAIGEFAKTAAKALDDLIENTDWDGFADRAEKALDSIKDDFAAVADSAKLIGTAIGKAGDVIGAGFHGVEAATAAVVSGTAKAGDAVLKFAEKLDEAAGSGGQLAKDLESTHAALQSIGAEAADAAKGQLKAVTDDLIDLGTGAAVAADGVKKQGEAAEEAAPKVTKHAEATERAHVAVENLNDKLPLIAPSLALAGDAAGTFSEQLESASRTAATLTDQSGTVVSGTDAIALAMQKLGTTSSQALEKAALNAATFFATVDQTSAKTAAGLRDRQDAFLRYAEIALAASAKQSDGEQRITRANLEAKAATLDVSDALKVLEGQASRTGNALLDGAEKSELAARQQRVAAETARAAAGNAQLSAAIAGDKAAAAATKAEQGFTEWGDAADAAALATQGITANTEHANDGMQRLTQEIGNARSEFGGISIEAQKFFDTALKGAFDLEHDLDGAGAGFQRASRAIQDAEDLTNKKIADSRKELQGLIDGFESAASGGTDAFGNVSGAIGGSVAQMQAFKDSLLNGTTQVGLLGQADLAPLIASIDAAISRAQALADKAAAAKEKFEGIVQAIDDALTPDDPVEKENKRFQQQLKDLRDAAKEAGKLNDLSEKRAEENAKKLHEKNLKDIEEEQKAKAGGGAGKASAGAAGATPTGNRGSGLANIGGGGDIGGIHIHLPPGTTIIGNDLQKAGEQIAGPVLKELQKLQQRSIKPILGR